MGIFALLDVIEHVILTSIFSLKFEDEAILKLISFLIDLIRHLKLCMWLWYSLDNRLKTLSRHHKCFLNLIIFLSILIYRKLIANLILLFLKILLERFIILCTHRNNNSSFPIFLLLSMIYTLVFFILYIYHLKCTWINICWLYTFFNNK